MKLATLSLLHFLLFPFTLKAQWQPAGDKIKTKWAKAIGPENVWAEYLRSQPVRANWQHLNGLWGFALLPVGPAVPSNFTEKMLVPFAVEPSLSGVQKNVGKLNKEKVLKANTELINVINNRR